MEDADSDSGFDSDGDWYHAGRDQLYGTRTDSTAVGPDGAHRRRFLCEEEKKGGTRWGCLSFVVKDIVTLKRHVTACLAPCDTIKKQINCKFSIIVLIFLSFIIHFHNI